MIRIFVLALAVSVCSIVVAQDKLPPTYEIRTDEQTYDTLDAKYWQLLEDKEGKWALEKISQSTETNTFHSNVNGKNEVNYEVNFYWLRYRLKNILNKEAKVCLTNIMNADQSDFYLLNKSNRWSHYTTGVLCPNAKKNGLKTINQIPIFIPPGEEVIIYNRLKNFYYVNKPKYIFVSIGFTDKVIQESYISKESTFTFREFNAIFTGILLFACIFSLFFYTIVKNRVYLYYALFLFYFLFDRSFLTDFVFPAHPLVLYSIEYFVKSTGILLFVQFTRYFLKTFNHFPKWDRALKYIAVIHPSIVITSFFIEPHLTGKWNGVLNNLSELSFTIGLFMLLITYLKFLNSPDRLTRVLQISAIPALIYWAFGFALMYSFNFLTSIYNIEPPKFIKWLNIRFDILNEICVIWLVMCFSWVLLLQFVQLRKENAQQALDRERVAKEKEIERRQLIEMKRIELERTVEERTSELKQSLDNLQLTQKQLIQSEKMASLGELTAGIAHEIQNPLNFVNNFSELNSELIKEMQDELKIGNNSEAIAISNEVKGNEEKINHHGKRADAIVKGMLLHAQASTGQKEPTDINALANEYLRLSYQGLRAKDKTFNATLQTDFDPGVGSISVIPKDIGRVLLNLYNNAFYAISEEKKQQPAGYAPTVSLSTKKVNGKVEISVKDNGKGIPQKVVDKIFQPFFTTKPTGQGTGLGLSMSYDIIKAHGGKIEVVAKEDEGAEFIIYLPI